MLKGFQIATYNVDLGTIKQSIRVVAGMGGNCVRYQMVAPDPRYLGEWPYQADGIRPEDDFRHWDFAKYEAWWWKQIANVRECLEMIIAERLPVQLVIDCHSPYKGAWGDLIGGKEIHLITLDDDIRRKWEALWLATVKHFIFRGLTPAIAGYDLCNEPAAKKERDWQRIAIKLAKKIRQLERYCHEKPAWIFITSTGGHPHRFKEMRRIGVKKVAVQAHFYYSGFLSKLSLKRKLRAALRYARKHDMPLYLGEIGCNRQHNGDEYCAEFFKKLLPILHDNKNVNRQGGGYTIHALNENEIFNYSGTKAMEVIKGWMQ